MDLLVKLLVWALNYIYPSRSTGATSAQNALDQAVLREQREESEARRKDRLVESFESTAIPTQGVVDYDEMKWESFSRVVEAPEKFVFYAGTTVAKTIPKAAFSRSLEVATLRRMIRRHVNDNLLLDD